LISISLALIPIGGYGPRWFMQDKHADPTDAVRIHLDLQSRQSVGIHWGTFVLTSEPLDEPPRLLAQACAERGVPAKTFRALAIGETLAVDTDPTEFQRNKEAPNKTAMQ
jgi:N-acyl-phosphatidylethanolamine-hydrolysing phospholipase D